MAKCTSILKGMPFCQGTPVKPGIRRRAFIVAYDDITKFADFERDELGRPTTATLTGSHTLAEGVKWLEIDHLPDKAEAKSETQGEFPSMTFNNTATLVHPTVTPEATAAITPFLNTDVIVLVEDMYGRFRQYGGVNWPARITPAQDLGQGAAGNAATTLSVAASDEVSLPFYEGAIITEEGTINEGE